MNELKLKLTLEEVNLVLGALNELPYKMVNTLILKIRSQAESEISKETELTEKKD